MTTKSRLPAYSTQVAAIQVMFLFLCAPVHAETLSEGEIQDRRVDQAALQSQETAEIKLKALLKKYKSTAREATLMMKLADVYHQSAEMEFRVAHGRAFTSKKPIKLNNYNTILTSLIAITSNLIETHSDFFAIDQALFMAAKAHEQLAHKELARSQYLRLIHQYPESPQAIPAYMALAELAIEKNQHLEAITYLTVVEHNPKTPYYPFALHKLAWSNYNLKHLEEAFNWIEKSVHYYDQVIENNSNDSNAPSSASDLAMRENILMDAVLFFNEAFEGGISRFELPSALGTFRKLEKGPLLGKMNLRFAKLLRANRKDKELFTWEHTIITQELNRPETIQVVTTLFEHLWNQRHYEQMLLVGKDLQLSYLALAAPERETEGAIASRKLLLEIANKFHEIGRATSAKDTAKTASLLYNLSAIYGVFLNLLPENDPRAPEAHYNLAEALFAGKDFQQATEHYSWILAHFNSISRLDKMEIALKAISSRYEELRNLKRIPTDLAAHRMDENGDPQKIQNLPKNLAEWIGWVDAFAHEYPVSRTQEGNKTETIENFQFEANRAIYHGGLVQLATNRLIGFATTHPLSKFAVPSSILALDTSLVTEDWSGAAALAARLLKTKKWNTSDFSARLREIEADCSYKIMEALFRKKDFQLAFEKSSPLIEKFTQTKRAPDLLMLSAQSALQLQKKATALEDFTLLIKNYPTSKAAIDARLTRAQLSEESYEFEGALNDYHAYLKAVSNGQDTASNNIPNSAPNHDPNNQDPNNERIHKRIYFLEWLIESPTVACPEPHLDECMRYRALSLLRDVKKSQASTPQAGEANQNEFNFGAIYLKEAMNGSREDRPIFSAVALKYGKEFELHQRLALLRILVTGWDKLDPMIRLSLLPVLTQIVPENFRRARLELKKAVPMKTISSKSITSRAEWIKELERTAGKILELPWNGIRAEVLGELSLAYSDFTAILETSPPPKNLSEPELKEYQKNLNNIIQPFHAKATELSEKAKNLAESRSEPGTFSYLSYLEKLDPKTDWTPVFQSPSSKSILSDLNSESTSEERLKSLWLAAYSNHSWAKNAFILQELQDKKLVNPSLLSIMRGLTLTASGAKAEAWLEIKPTIDELKAIDEGKARKSQ